MSCLADDSSLWATRLSYSTCSWGFSDEAIAESVALSLLGVAEDFLAKDDSSTAPAVVPSRSAVGPHAVVNVRRS